MLLSNQIENGSQTSMTNQNSNTNLNGNGHVAVITNLSNTPSISSQTPILKVNQASSAQQQQQLSSRTTSNLSNSNAEETVYKVNFYQEAKSSKNFYLSLSIEPSGYFIFLIKKKK